MQPYLNKNASQNLASVKLESQDERMIGYQRYQSECIARGVLLSHDELDGHLNARLTE